MYSIKGLIFFFIFGHHFQKRPCVNLQRIWAHTPITDKCTPPVGLVPPTLLPSPCNINADSRLVFWSLEHGSHTTHPFTCAPTRIAPLEKKPKLLNCCEAVQFVLFYSFAQCFTNYTKWSYYRTIFVVDLSS